MKMYIKFSVVIVMVLSIVGIARNSPAWASSLSAVAAQPIAGSSSQSDLDVEPGSVRPPAPTLTIKESGTYTVGGICSLTVEYKAPKLSDRVIVRKSAGVPFPKENGELYLPGIDLTHFKSNKLMNEMSVDDGSWKICFASRPDKVITIYYLDTFSSTTPTWIALETTIENGQACAQAYVSGLYAPAGK